MTFPDQSALVGVPGTVGRVAPSDNAAKARDALDFVMDLQQDFLIRDQTYELIDKVIFLEQAVNIPENYKNTAVEVRTPFPRHIANQITAALSINSPKVHFNPIKFGDEGENEAAYRARFFEGSWTRQQREKKRRIFRLFMDSVVTKGDGWLKTFERKNRAWAKYTPYSRDLLKQLDAQVKAGEIDQDHGTRMWDAKTEEMKRRLPYPIETTEVPPECMYYQKGEDGFTRIAEVSAVPYYDTLLKHGVGLNDRGQVVGLDSVTGIALPSDQWGATWPKNHTGRKMLQRVELWDAETCQIIIRGPGDLPKKGMKDTGSGYLVREWKHGYGDENLGTLRGPYFHAPGILTSSREPHKAHLSVLFAFMHLFPLLNSLLTMQSQSAFSTAYPAFRRTTPPAYNIPDSPFGAGADEIVASREKIVPGAVFPHDIAPMDQPHAGIDLDKAISFVKSMIDLALPDTVQGAVSGEMAGYTLNQAAHMATLIWGPIVDNVQDCLSDRLGWESTLIDEFIGETVYVWGAVPQNRKVPGQPRGMKDGWMGLGPKEIDGVHNYDVTLEPATINNDELELRILKQKLDMRLIDPSEAIRSIGGNPVEVDQAWLLFELKQDPEIRGNLRQRVFQKLGTIEQQAMQALGPEGQPQAPASGLPPGAQPGISQGTPTTGFVPPAGSVAPAAPPEQPTTPGVPGVPAGAPAGARGVPQEHLPLPGGG